MKRISFLALLLTFVLTASAQVNRANVEFFFGQNQDQVEAGIGDNASQLVVLDSIARDFNKVSIENRYVVIHSYTSPDGSAEANQTVASKRAAAVEKLFDSKLATDAHVIYIPHYFEWGDIKALVKGDAMVPNQQEVLSLIETEERQISLSNAVASEQLIQRIKAIDNGSTYYYIANNLFPKLHRVTLEVRYVNGVGYPEAVQKPHVEVSDAISVEKPQVEEPQVVVPEVPVIEPEVPVIEPEVPVTVPEVPETVPEVPETVPEVPETVPEVSVTVPEVPVVEAPVTVVEDSAAVQPQPVEQEPVPVQVPDTIQMEKPVEQVVADTLHQDTLGIKQLEEIETQVQRSDSTRSFWSEFASRTALKTNLLYDIALVPNVAVEYAVSDKFSVSLDWMYAWWSRDAKHDYWRVYGGDVELRYWLGSKDGQRFTGHHVGAYGGMLTYDVEWGGTGYMGEKWSYLFGLSYGYALPVSRRLRLDFELGVGYMSGEYYEYEPEGDKYFWQQTKNRRWFGPTRAEVSLVWLLGRK